MVAAIQGTCSSIESDRFLENQPTELGHKEWTLSIKESLLYR